MATLISRGSAPLALRIVDADFTTENFTGPSDAIAIATAECLNARCGPPLGQGLIARLPVLRLFGTTAAGQKAAAHVHGVLPYLYVPAPGNVEPSRAFLVQLAEGIDRALHNALDRATKGQALLTQVYSIQAVRRVPFYGYYEEPQLFLQIFILNPWLKNRLMELLLQGAVLGVPMQPYEAHFPYVMQFLADFNLFGMQYVHIAHFTVRAPAPVDGSLSFFVDKSSALFDDGPLPFDVSATRTKQTTCFLEIDVVADVLATDYVHSSGVVGSMPSPKNPVNPGLQNFVADGERRRVQRGAETTQPKSRGTDAMEPTQSDNERYCAALLKRSIARDKSDLELAVADSDTQTRDTDLLSTQRPVSQSATEAIDLLMMINDDIHNQTDNDDELQRDDAVLLEAEESFEMSQAWNAPLPLFTSTPSVEHAISDACASHSKNLPVVDENAELLLEEESNKKSCCFESCDGQILHIGLSPRPPSSQVDRSMCARPPPPLVQSPAVFVATSVADDDFQPTGARVFRKRVSFSDALIVGTPVKSRTTALSPAAHSESAVASPEASGAPVVLIAHDLPVLPEPFQPPPAAAVGTCWRYHRPPPTTAELAATRVVPTVLYQSAFYGNISDMPASTPRKVEKLPASFLRHFAPVLPGEMPGVMLWDHAAPPLRQKAIEPAGAVYSFARDPPSVARLEAQIKFQTAPQKSHLAAMVEGPTPEQTFRFKYKTQHNEVFYSVFVVVVSLDGTAVRQFLSLLTLELQTISRDTLLSDPAIDGIEAIVYALHHTDVNITDSVDSGACERGVFLLRRPDDVPLHRRGITGVSVHLVDTEVDLVTAFGLFVRRGDPDFLVGFEVQMASWGFLLARSKVLGVDLAVVLSRVPGESTESAPLDEYGQRHTSELQVKGRVVLNVWRLMRKELALTMYSFEAVVFHILHKRVPHYSQQCLHTWYHDDHQINRGRVVRHLLSRVDDTLNMLLELNFINRTSEFARLFGILFEEVLSRGSQWRVESIMSRLAHAHNFVLLSPNREQVRACRAPEALPLIMEPDSKFYTSPVVVLDFQSLYPSVVIAHNLCFSTCLGKLHKKDAVTKEVALGVTALRVPVGLTARLADRDGLHIAPSETVFCSKNIRHGILGRMLDDILSARVLVKSAMKRTTSPTLRRQYDARQLGLKLIANVTYGYTAATFSGRMPSVDVADAIVKSGREALEKAMALVRSNPRWRGAQIVYGDTDSMFVHLPGASKEEAFVIGQEMAVAISAMFPSPMKMKFEKVYLPCFLETKKRYVGFSYETVDQKEPVFDAKGIETVRRDGCPMVGKILERAMRTLFVTKDISAVKAFTLRQWQKIVEGTVNPVDFIFAKEYRGRDGYTAAARVPALDIALRLRARDARAEPLPGTRVPYVVVHGPPGASLLSLVRRPQDFIEDPSLRLNTTYYIVKQIIPAMQRAFGLMGINVASWFEAMPRRYRVEADAAHGGNAPQRGGATTIGHFYARAHCRVCDAVSQTAICAACVSQPQASALKVVQRYRGAEKEFACLLRICAQCQGVRDFADFCTAVECPVYYERARRIRQLDSTPCDVAFEL